MLSRRAWMGQVAAVAGAAWLRPLLAAPAPALALEPAASEAAAGSSGSRALPLDADMPGYAAIYEAAVDADAGEAAPPARASRW